MWSQRQLTKVSHCHRCFSSAEVLPILDCFLSYSPSFILQCTSLSQTRERSRFLAAIRGSLSRSRIHRHPPLSPTRPLMKRKSIGVRSLFGPNIVPYFAFEAFVWTLSGTSGDTIASNHKKSPDHWIPVGPYLLKEISRMKIPFVPTQVLCIS